MRMHLIFGLAAASLIAAPATAAVRGEGATPSAAAAKTAKPAKGERKICRRYEKPGSHASEKICLTRAEWDQIERNG